MRGAVVERGYLTGTGRDAGARGRERRLFSVRDVDGVPFDHPRDENGRCDE